MKKKSIISGFLALVMSVSMMSFTAFATEPTEPVADPVAKTVTVSNEDQFMAISNYSNGAGETKDYPRDFSGWTIIIADDLDMTGYTWQPLVNFYGSMTGKTDNRSSATISHVTVSVAEKAGLCANSANGLFSDLTISDSSFITSNGYNGHYAGAFAASGFTSSFENCDVINTTVKGVRFVGGVTGYSYGNITDCDVTNCEILSNANALAQARVWGDNIGGIVGLLCEGNMTVNNCMVTDTNVTGYRQVGGITGATLYGDTIINCTVSSCNITATGIVRTSTDRTKLTPCAGGIVGQFAAGSDNEKLKITIKESKVLNSTISQSNTTVTETYIGWAVGDANTRLTASQYEVSGNTQNDVTGIKGNTTVTLNEIGYIAANPSLPAAE